MPYEEQKTKLGSTVTSDGDIPHLRRHGLSYPVKLQRRETSRGETTAYELVTDRDGRPAPFRRYGRLVYVAPGGGEYRPF